VGVTTPEPPPHVSAYEDWLMLGRHGSMDYLAGERAQMCRRDPRLILPECRSILILGMRYPNPKNTRPDEEAGPSGRVAAYAWAGITTSFFQNWYGHWPHLSSKRRRSQ